MVRSASGRAVSVVMATWNGAAHISDQLDSIAAQTLPPAELVVGDEGSEDGTVQIVEGFARRAPFPVRLIRNPRRLGAAENFLSLSAKAHGPLVALSDWDDVWGPRKLERAVPWFDDPRVGLLVHRSLVVDEQLQPVGRRYPAIRRTAVRPPRHVDPWLAVPGMAMVFRRALLDAVGTHGVDRPREAGGLPMDHDDWLYLLSGSLARTVLLADDLTLYRQHGASYMGAPGGPPGEQVERALRLGADDFRRQASMFRDRAAFWTRVATDPATRPAVRAGATAAARWDLRLAGLQDARSTVRDVGRARIARLARLGSLAMTGGYGPRTHAGLGLRALAADLVGMVRPGPARPAQPATEALAGRVATARALGRSTQSVIAELEGEGVLPPYGGRWTEEMVRDLVYQARRTSEAAAVAAQAESRDRSTVDAAAMAEAGAAPSDG